jgi:CubicO group peptidase (beta-lactamase class C family)
VTKSFIFILAGIALDNNFITSLNEKLFDFFPEYELYLNWNELKNQITLKHLITMTAGFDWQEDGESFFSLIYPTSDWIKSTLDLPVVHTPGSYWDYFSPGPDVLGAVISKACGLPLSEFARQYLFNPMSITDVEWYITPTGRAFGGGCHRMRPIDMTKIGYLILNDGNWQGQQIISPGWIAESTLERNANYGYLCWIFDIKRDNS